MSHLLTKCSTVEMHDPNVKNEVHYRYKFGAEKTTEPST
jgi:hypothetical protein